MVTLQTLLATSLVLLALGVVLGAGLYWRDNKAKVGRALWRVLTLVLRVVEATVLGAAFIPAAIVVLIGGFVSLVWRVLAGHRPSNVCFKVLFDQ